MFRKIWGYMIDGLIITLALALCILFIPIWFFFVLIAIVVAAFFNFLDKLD